MRSRFRQQEVWENMGLDVDACLEAVDNAPYFKMYQSLLFQRIVPCVKDIGLWSSRVQDAYDAMGVLEMADVDLDMLMAADERTAEILDEERAEIAARKEQVDDIIAMAD
jgi:hypothetical protein